MPQHDVKSLALFGTVFYTFFSSGAPPNTGFIGDFDTAKFPNGVTFYTTIYWNSSATSIMTRILKISQSDRGEGPFTDVPLNYLNGTYAASENNYPLANNTSQTTPLVYNSIGIHSNKRFLKVEGIIVNDVNGSFIVSIEMVGGVKVLPVNPQQIAATY